MSVEATVVDIENLMNLIEFHASDGVVLHGAIHAPPADKNGNANAACDAAIYLHGAGSNFYSGSLLPGILPDLNSLGLTVMAINTRGHDSVCTLRTSQGARPGGAAYEVVDQCRHDVRGAVDFLLGRGQRNVALIGHSLGALKAIYSQAHDPHENVSRVIAISPPRLSYAEFLRGPRRAEFSQAMSRAEQLLAAGESDHLMHVTVPLPLLITAGGYVDKYGPAERYNFLKFAAEVSQPAHYLFGRKEISSTAAAYGNIDESVRQLAGDAPANIDVSVIDGADHFYTGCHQALAAAIGQPALWQ